MVDVSGIDWNWWVSVAWWLIPVGILVVIAVLAWRFIRSVDLREDIALRSTLVAATWFIGAGLISMGAIPSTAVGAWERQIATEQLNEQGFEHVEMSGLSRFTASKGGGYFQGLLYEVGDHKYQVVEVPLD